MKFRTKFVAVAMGVLSTILLSASQSQAATTWDAVKAKVANAKDYACKYTYDGPKGHAVIEYGYVANPLAVRTKLLPGSTDEKGAKKVGVVVYNPAKDDKVVARIGNGQIKRSIDHVETKGTSLYQSVFGLIIKDAGTGAPKVSVGEDFKGKPTTLFTFGNGYKIWATDDGDIVHAQKFEGSKMTEDRRFTEITWNCNPKVDF